MDLNSFAVFVFGFIVGGLVVYSLVTSRQGKVDKENAKNMNEAFMHGVNIALYAYEHLKNPEALRFGMKLFEGNLYLLQTDSKPWSFDFVPLAPHLNDYQLANLLAFMIAADDYRMGGTKGIPDDIAKYVQNFMDREVKENA